MSEREDDGAMDVREKGGRSETLLLKFGVEFWAGLARLGTRSEVLSQKVARIPWQAAQFQIVFYPALTAYGLKQYPLEGKTPVNPWLVKGLHISASQEAKYANL